MGACNTLQINTRTSCCVQSSSCLNAGPPSGLLYVTSYGPRSPPPRDGLPQEHALGLLVDGRLQVGLQELVAVAHVAADYADFLDDARLLVATCKAASIGDVVLRKVGRVPGGDAKGLGVKVDGQRVNVGVGNGGLGAKALEPGVML